MHACVFSDLMRARADVAEALFLLADKQPATTDVMQKRDLTTIALRAATHPEARVARRALALQDQTVGLLTEILVAGRSRGELRREVDPIQAARVVIHATTGARLAWANGQIGPEECRTTLDGAVSLLFRGLEQGAPEA